MSITITVPNDDHVALRAMAKALEEIAVARGAPALNGPFTTEIKIDMSDESVKEHLQRATQDLMQAAPAMLRENHVDRSIEVHGKRKEVEVDTTSQQVESLSDTDSTGTPWDERIHSASKALNSDGTWRVRRKPKDMDEAEWSQFLDAVQTYITSDEEDLERLFPNGFDVNYKANSEQPVQDEPPVTPAGDDFHVDTGVVTEHEVAAIPAPPLPVPPAPPVPNVETVSAMDELNNGTEAEFGHEYAHYTFPQVMQFLTERHGRITSAQVDQIIGDMGLNSIMDLNTQPEHTGPFIARVKALLGE